MLGLFAACGAEPAPLTPPKAAVLPPQRSVVVISIDGLRREYLDDQMHAICVARCWTEEMSMPGPIRSKPSPTAAPVAPEANAVPGISDAIDIATSGMHTCVVLGDAGVRCWGRNESGQLGEGSAEMRGAPGLAPRASGL